MYCISDGMRDQVVFRIGINIHVSMRAMLFFVYFALSHPSRAQESAMAQQKNVRWSILNVFCVQCIRCGYHCCWFFCCWCCCLLLLLHFTLYSGYFVPSFVWFFSLVSLRYVSFRCVCCYFFLCDHVRLLLSSIHSFGRSFHSFSMDHMNCLRSISFTLPTNIHKHTYSVSQYTLVMSIYLDVLYIYKEIILIFSFHRSLSLFLTMPIYSFYMFVSHVSFSFFSLHLPCVNVFVMPCNFNMYIKISPCAIERIPEIDSHLVFSLLTTLWPNAKKFNETNLNWHAHTLTYVHLRHAYDLILVFVMLRMKQLHICIDFFCCGYVSSYILQA